MAKKQVCDPCRRNKVGGQAVIEGVMMKKGEETALATRCDDGRVDIKLDTFVPIRKKIKFLGIPILRGVVGFIESMILSFKTMNASTDVLGLEEEESKSEAWLKKHLGIKLTDVIMILGMVLGIVLALGLFMFLPSFLAKDILNGMLLAPNGINLNQYALSAIEGGVKILIFIAYLLLVSAMKDIRRVFQYHGAEHKSIACYEAGLELTPENARKCTRFHPRCGTSFMFVMILVGILVGMFIPAEWPTWARSLTKLATLPIVMGLGYEFIMLAGKHDNLITRIMSAPGLWMQRITTKEPSDDQLAIAICAIKATMPEEFPDFDPSEYAIEVEDNLKHIAFTGLKKDEVEKLIEKLKAKRAQAELEAENEPNFDTEPLEIISNSDTESLDGDTSCEALDESLDLYEGGQDEQDLADLATLDGADTENDTTEGEDDAQ
ncbi:MAG: DUF1385 domain-containing protein [Clostridia bacterium]|nr:DUF1385 domain-containing protein [Clostridia bacterium]